MRPRILIAGIGNIFLGDDAFGVEVAQRLTRRGLPEEVRVVDFGIRGLDLSYALLDGYESVILVDAVPRGGAPGTLYVLETEIGDNAEPYPDGTLLEMHRLDPDKVLRLAAHLGAKVEHLLVVGCETAATGDYEDMHDGLSDPVRLAVEQAIPLIEALAARLLRGERIEAIENPIQPVKEVLPCRD
jgi:hydrogenase maturation protease